MKQVHFCNSFILIAFFSEIFTRSSSTRVFTRIVSGQEWKYIIDDSHNNFETAVSWCKNLGGELPTVHSTQDFNYLTDTVVVQYSPGPPSTWLGLRKESASCTKWLDDSPWDYGLANGLSDSCAHCTASCCALKVWSDKNHRNVQISDCSNTARGVCVLKTLFVSDKEFDNQFTSVKNSISTESKLTKDLVNTRANEIKTLIKNELTDSRDEMQEVKSLILDTLDNQAESILESLVNQSSLSQTVQQRIQLHYQEVLPQQMSNFSAQITKLRADFTQEFEDTNSFMARTSWLVYSLFIIVVIVLLVGITVTCRRIRRLRNENKHIVHYNSVEFGKPNNLGNKKSSSMEETIMNY